MRKGSKMTLEQRKRLSEAHKRLIPWNKGRHYHLKHSGSFKKGQVPWMKGKHHTEETRKKISEISKKRWQNPYYRKHMSKVHKGKPSLRKGKHIQTNTGRTHFKKGLIPWNKGKQWSKEQRKKLRVAIKKAMANPEVKKRLSEALKGRISPRKGKQWSKEMRKKLSITIKKGMANPETRKKLREHRAKQIIPVKDTKIEVKIQNFLNKLNIEFMTHKYIKKIDHSYRCDIFIPSKNLIIECDGDYWHGNINNSQIKILNKHQIKQKARDKIRTKELTEKDFKVLRLWRSDIKKMTINDFKNNLFSLIL